MNNPIEVYRRLLERTLDGAMSSDETYSKGIAAATRALLADYNNLFPKDIYDGNRAGIELLISKHCSNVTKQCPICRSIMALKTGQYGEFLACKQSDCGGARSYKTGKPTINMALKNFLSDIEQANNGSRFRNLEL